MRCVARFHLTHRTHSVRLQSPLSRAPSPTGALHVRLLSPNSLQCLVLRRTPTLVSYGGFAALTVVYLTDFWIGKPVYAAIPIIRDRVKDK